MEIGFRVRRRRNVGACDSSLPTDQENQEDRRDHKQPACQCADALAHAVAHRGHLFSVCPKRTAVLAGRIGKPMCIGSTHPRPPGLSLGRHGDGRGVVDHESRRQGRVTFIAVYKLPSSPSRRRRMTCPGCHRGCDGPPQSRTSSRRPTPPPRSCCRVAGLHLRPSRRTIRSGMLLSSSATGTRISAIVSSCCAPKPATRFALTGPHPAERQR